MNRYMQELKTKETKSKAKTNLFSFLDDDEDEDNDFINDKENSNDDNSCNADDWWMLKRFTIWSTIQKLLVNMEDVGSICSPSFQQPGDTCILPRNRLLAPELKRDRQLVNVKNSSSCKGIYNIVKLCVLHMMKNLAAACKYWWCGEHLEYMFPAPGGQIFLMNKLTSLFRAKERPTI